MKRNDKRTGPLTRLLAACAAAVCLASPIVLSLTTPVLAAPKAVFLPQIEGGYAVQGLNPDGTRYQGSVRITVKDGTAFFRRDIAGKSFHGQGPLTGNTLIIDWGQANPVIYTINSDGTLTGSWAAGRASEFLRRLN